MTDEKDAGAPATGRPDDKKGKPKPKPKGGKPAVPPMPKRG